MFSQLAGPRPGVRRGFVANPPTEQELVGKKVVATGAVVAGVALVYGGAFAQAIVRGVFV